MVLFFKVGKPNLLIRNGIKVMTPKIYGSSFGYGRKFKIDPHSQYRIITEVISYQGNLRLKLNGREQAYQPDFLLDQGISGVVIEIFIKKSKPGDHISVGKIRIVKQQSDQDQSTIQQTVQTTQPTKKLESISTTIISPLESTPEPSINNLESLPTIISPSEPTIPPPEPTPITQLVSPLKIITKLESTPPASTKIIVQQPVSTQSIKLESVPTNIGESAAPQNIGSSAVSAGGSSYSTPTKKIEIERVEVDTPVEPEIEAIEKKEAIKLIKLQDLSEKEEAVILYVEPQKIPISQLIKLIPIKLVIAGKLKIYLPNLSQTKQAQKYLISKFGHSQILMEYLTIDQSLDEYLYQTAIDQANSILDGLHQMDDQLVTPINRLALHTSLMDRIVMLIRQPVKFRQLWEEEAGFNKSKPRVIYLPAPNYHFNPMHQILTKIIGQAPEVSLELLPSNWVGRVQRDYQFNSLCPRVSIIKIYHRTPEKEDARKKLVIIGNLADKLYRKTILSIIARVPTNWRTDVFSYNSTKVKKVNGNFYFRSNNYRLKVPSSDKTAILGALNLYNEKLDQTDDWTRELCKLLHNNLVGFLPQIIIQARYLIKYFEKVEADCLLCSPGRPQDCQLAVGLANLKNIPTIEIQNGTLIPSLRFTSPVSRLVLCIDQNSQQVYINNMGLNQAQVKIVGCPRMDSTLRGLRQLPKGEVQKIRGNFKGKTILFAPQPIGVQVNSKILTIIIQAVIALISKSHQDYQIIIKLHQSEGESYREEYQRVARQLKFAHQVKILTDRPIEKLIASADLVVTYYSSVGLEAFILHKPVIVVNPVPSQRPPFDLYQLGVGYEVTNSQQLQDLIPKLTPFTQRAIQQNQSLRYLEDGQSVERIIQEIKRQMNQKNLKKSDQQ